MLANELRNVLAIENGRARFATWLLAGCIAVGLVAVYAGWSQHALLSRMAAGIPLEAQEAERNDARYALIGLLQILTAVVTGIVWLSWLHRACENLTLVGTERTRFSPGWSVGYWFIPFVNLVRPYQIVSDVWMRSDSANAVDPAPGSPPRPAAVGWWWAAYLFSGFASRAGRVTGKSAKTIDELINSTDLAMGVDLMWILAALLAIKVVRGIDERQQRFQEVPSGTLTT